MAFADYRRDKARIAARVAEVEAMDDVAALRKINREAWTKKRNAERAYAYNSNISVSGWAAHDAAALALDLAEAERKASFKRLKALGAL